MVESKLPRNALGSERFVDHSASAAKGLSLISKISSPPFAISSCLNWSFNRRERFSIHKGRREAASPNLIYHFKMEGVLAERQDRLIG